MEPHTGESSASLKPADSQARWPLGLAVGGLLAGAVLGRVPRPAADSFRHRIVLVTGGARGLGLALARRLAAEGATLVLLSRSPDELERAVNDLRRRGGRASALVCDIRDQAQVTDAIARVLMTHHRIDVLVNN